jgi:hypothetical protein
MSNRSRLALLLVSFLGVPLVTGAKGDCGAVNSRTAAPDVEGAWSVAYDDSLAVEIAIGGAVHTREIGAGGGTITIDHDGVPFTFDLDCSRVEVVCPSEAWPEEVTAAMREPEFPHRMWVTLPMQECNGTRRAALASECGDGTSNPDCEDVCEGEVITRPRDTFGVIGEDGTSFQLFLGAGIATNGVNCALLGVSEAHADLRTTGSPEGDWQAIAMENGEVIASYSGGCLWVGDPDMDAELEALAVGASVKFTTGFTASRTVR